jgi:hypothetical protein
MSFSFQGREAAPPASAGVGVGGQALRYPTKARLSWGPPFESSRARCRERLMSAGARSEGGLTPLKMDVQTWK